MLKPYDPALMEAYAVSRAVNSVKNDTEECIEPPPREECLRGRQRYRGAERAFFVHAGRDGATD